MKTFKMRALQAAVVAGLGALGVSGAANAVHVNPDGLGQVLVYSYYSAQVATPVVCADKTSAHHAPYRLVGISDNSCATSFPTKRSPAVSPFKRAINNDPWAQQKVKAKAYVLAFKQQHSATWQQTNSAIGGI